MRLLGRVIENIRLFSIGLTGNQFIQPPTNKEELKGGSDMKLSLITIGCLLLLLLGCSPAVRPHDHVGVVKAEIEEINKGQVEVASSYFSDNAQMVS